jgi:hypothetical protein
MFGFAFVAVIRGFVLEEPAFQEAPSVVHASSGVPAVGWSREQLGPAPAAGIWTARYRLPRCRQDA